jgi:hypothetical protein
VNRLKTLSVAGMFMLAAVPLQAQVIDFEDLPAAVDPVPNGYQGFNWNNFYTMYSGYYTNSGYNNMDGRIGIFNGFAGMAVTSQVGTFDFQSALIGAAWNDGLTVDVRGLLNGVELFSTALTVGTAMAQNFVFGWNGINELRFSSFGGQNAGLEGSGEHFIMDNMAFNTQQVVPEPITMLLLATGLVGIGAVRRRRNGIKA